MGDIKSKVVIIALFISIIILILNKTVLANISIIAPLAFISLIIIFLYLSKFYLNELKLQLRKIDRLIILTLGVIFIFGLVIRLLAPHFFIYYTDEFTNSEIAKNIIMQGKAQTCEFDYENTVCSNYDVPKGVPVILSI